MAKQTFIDKLISRRASRKGDENAFLNLVSNLYTERMLVRVLVSQKLPEIWTKLIISHYLVSLVTCWETFFRDVFVFLLNRNPGIADKFVHNTRVKKVLGRAPTTHPDQVEYIASIFNFQNLDSLLAAFGPILGEHETLDLPTKEDVFLHSKRKGWVIFNFPALFPEWKRDLDFILQERHRIIHDANHPCTVSRKDIQQLESVLFFYLQLFGILVSNRFHLPWIRLDIRTLALNLTSSMDEHLKNIVITFDDLIADDWVTLNR